MDCMALYGLAFLLLGSVGGLASIEVKPSMNPIPVGQNVTFTVVPETPISAGTWSHETGAIMLWYPSGSPIVFPSYSGRVVFNISTGALFLKSVTLADSGNYVLKGISEPITASTYLSVQAPVSNVTVRANATDLVEFNDSVSLTCSASGSSLNFLWFNGSSAISISSRVQLSDGNRTLTVSGVLRFDEGPLYCVVSNSISNNTSQLILLRVRYGPSNLALTISPEAGAYRSGSDLKLSCSSRSNPPALYEWAFDGRSLNQKGSQLRLANVQQNQTGNYTCTAYNNVTLRVASVATRASIIDPVSKATVNITKLPVLNGNFTLNCSTTGPVISIQWLKDGWPLSSNNRTTFSVDNSSVTFSLVQLSDNGRYQCAASNAVSNQTSPEYKLLVNYGPDQPVITGPDTAETDSVITFNCTASSEPPSQYSWFFNGTQAAQGPVFQTGSLTLASSGKYTCVAFNSVTGRNGSAVKELRVVAGISLVTVRPNPPIPILSTNLTLTCDISGFATAIKWLKGDQPLQPSEHVVFKNNSSAVSFSPTLQVSDDGNYQCIASNTLRSKTSPVFPLLVNYGPETPIITGLTSVSEGSTVILDCYGRSQPPSQYYWIFNNSPDFIAATPKYTIFYARVTDAGRYTCVARNGLLNTTSSASIFLEVTSASGGLHHFSEGHLSLALLLWGALILKCLH